MGAPYRDVPGELLTRLEQFRTRYPAQGTSVASTDWRYIVGGSGEDALLLLTGAACVAEMGWTSIEHFARTHRVVAPDYPALDTMAALVDGIAGLMDRQGIPSAHVMGGSYGGLVAQVFVRRHPGRTKSLILSHTLVPDPETATRIARSTRWMRWLPMPVLRTLLKLRLGRLFPKGAGPEVALSKALFADIVDSRLTRGQILGLMRRVVDLGSNYRFEAEDLSNWPGRILLLMGEDDPATPPAAREALRALYPRAEVRTFSGAGHLTALVKQEEYFAATDGFLKASGRAQAARFDGARGDPYHTNKPSMPRFALVTFALGCAALSGVAPTTTSAQSPARKADISMARDTTYFLEPVRPDGTIDYGAAMDAIYGKGLRPGDNAAIPLFQAFGPGPFLQGPKEGEASARKGLADVLKRLEISSLPESGPYFRTPDSSVTVDILKAKKSPWSGVDYPRVQAWLTANEGPLSRVVEASRRPRLWFPRPIGSAWNAPPFFGELTWAGNALSARAMLQLRAGNNGAAWADVLAIHRLAALEARDGRVTSWLQAQTTSIAAHEAAAAVITQGNSDAVSARARLADLAAISAFPSSAEVADRIVRAETLEPISRLAVERSAEDLKFLKVPALAGDTADWSVVLRTANGWVDRLVTIGRRPMGRDRRGALRLWDQQMKAAGEAAGKALAPEAIKNAGRNVISRALGDLLSSLFLSGGLVVADEYPQLRGDLTRVALALAVYRADQGAYPVSLAELSPGVLPRLPKDPFTGTTLAYERQGAGYLLHSPGLDQRFDREHGGSGDDVVLRVR